MAAREFAEIWGEQMHAARHLRVVTGALALVVLVLALAVVRLAWAPQPKPLVVRVDEVGRAEAVSYEAMEAQADPLDPTTGFFLHRFVVDHYSRRRGSVREYWERSLWFLTPAVANAAYAEQAEDVAATAVGLRTTNARRGRGRTDPAAAGRAPQPRRRPSTWCGCGAGKYGRARVLVGLDALLVPAGDPGRAGRPQPDGDRHLVPPGRPDRHEHGRPMIPHLQDRAPALEALGWTGRDAEWLALVCLHSGVFLRAQYLAFLGRDHGAAATRFIERYRGWCAGRTGRAGEIERAWHGTKRLCMVAPRSLYRAVGAEHVRHRREASETVLLRRLLSLDYVLDHLAEPWLATEGEKVAALTATGVPEPALPRRVYRGRRNAQPRYFAHKLPLALGAGRATFVFVQAEDVTPSGVRTWGETHADLWAALRVAGRAIEVVVVGRDPVRLAAAGQVLDGWTRVTAPADAGTGPLDEAARGARAELAAIRQTVAAGDLAALEVYGGLNGALARMRDLAAPGAAGTGRGTPAITRGRTWRSTRVPE